MRYTWRFKIHDNLRWSDGSSLNLNQIEENLLRIAKAPTRHLQELRNLKKITIDKKLNELTLIFSTPTTNSILHELSLADSSIVHAENLGGNWNKTSGAYSIKSLDRKKKEITLSSNPYSRHLEVNPEMPKEIKLSSSDYSNNFNTEIKNENLDIFTLPVPSLKINLEKVKSPSFNKLDGYPTCVYFFYFTPDSLVSATDQARYEFSFLVKESFRKMNFPSQFKLEDQLIPEGFPGRITLNTKDNQSFKVKELKNQKIIISVSPAFKDYPWFANSLKTVFSDNNIELTINFDYFAKIKHDKKVFSYLTIFKGNQKDSLGSWSYLFSKTGQLEMFASRLKTSLEDIVSKINPEERNNLLLDLHQEVIENNYGVPVLIESVTTLSSNKISLEDWDRFDMRPRFYLVKRK